MFFFKKGVHSHVAFIDSYSSFAIVADKVHGKLSSWMNSGNKKRIILSSLKLLVTALALIAVAKNRFEGAGNESRNAIT